MKRITGLLAVVAALFAFTAAAPAHADPGVECTYTGNLIIISLTGPVTIICDGDATVTHNTTITVSPKLFDPAPPPPGP